MTPEELAEKFGQIAADTISDAQAVDCEASDYIIGLQQIVDELLTEIAAAEAMKS